MYTERRTCPRLPVSLDVVLNHRAQSVICTMRDISLGGAFLDAEPDLLPYAGTVELSLLASTDSARAQLRLLATIERTTERGAAVSFGDVGRDAYFQLVDLVTSN
jgi:PilZ domain